MKQKWMVKKLWKNSSYFFANAMEKKGILGKENDAFFFFSLLISMRSSEYFLSSNLPEV